MISILGTSGPIAFLYFVFALLVALTIHEFSHAYVAMRLGDPTAKMMGRVTLDPRAHIDPIGALFMFLVGFGWGKPVPVNPTQIRGGKVGVAHVSIAGPASNIILAFLVGLFSAVFSNASFMTENLNVFLSFLFSLNFFLGLFNLIPVPPLDGYKIAVGYLPPKIAYEIIRFNAGQNRMLTFLLAYFGFRVIAEPIYRLFVEFILFIASLF